MLHVSQRSHRTFGWVIGKCFKNHNINYGYVTDVVGLLLPAVTAHLLIVATSKILQLLNIMAEAPI